MSERTQALPLTPAGLAPAPSHPAGPDLVIPPAATDSRRQRERQRRLRRLLKRALLLLLAALVALVLVRALLPDAIPVEVATVEHGSMQVTVDESGRTRVKDRFVLSAPVSGRIARISLRPGDTVAEGAVIAVITPVLPPLLDVRTRAEMETRVAAARFGEEQARAAADRAAAALEHARLEAERTQRLQAGGAATAVAVEAAEYARRARAGELASAQFGVKVAEEELRRARAALERPAGGAGRESVHLRSPVAGRVLKLLHESEGVVQAGAPILEVGDPTALEVVVDVLTADAVGIQPGARVSVESWGGARPLTGRVRQVEPSAFVRVSPLGVEEQRVNVLIDIEGTRELRGSLGDGFRVEARILLWETERALVAPSSAVVRSGQDWAVYRVEEQRARLRPVTVSHRNARQVEILTGVQPGDRLVLYPGDSLAEGRRVTTRRPGSP